MKCIVINNDYSSIAILDLILTNKEKEFNLDTYKLDERDYLVKPITLKTLKSAIFKAKKGVSAQQNFYINLFSANP